MFKRDGTYMKQLLRTMFLLIFVTLVLLAIGFSILHFLSYLGVEMNGYMGILVGTVMICSVQLTIGNPLIWLDDKMDEWSEK